MTFSPIDFLKKLIQTPSFSREETEVRIIFESFFTENNIAFETAGNNIWAKNRFFNPAKPTILLNSHCDTVKPNISYTHNPFEAQIGDGKLYGLGSNDAGGALVSLMAVFLHFYEKRDLGYNLIFAVSAEEEISGKNGMELLVKKLPEIDLAIIGEPTGMQMAIAEKGLLVLDCVSIGVAGHAARDEGDNAIYRAMKDIEWFRSFQFSEVSETLGRVKMNVTLVNAGTQHNVIPDECRFVVDIRVTDAYELEEVISIIEKNVESEINPRSVRLRPSKIATGHPIVQKGLSLGLNAYGSPTLSDQALIPYTSIKIGPGESARSHTADEFIYLSEIEEGIKIYIDLLDGLTL